MISIDIATTLHENEGRMDLEIQLEIQEGEFLALSGVSGSGKTTLLRILAGLEDARGRIEVAGVLWLDAKTKLAVQKRDIGFVCQEYALFEHMSVQENLLYVAQDKALAEELLELTELSQLKDKKASRLSGGQKQRLALCRAMMSRPKLLLLDEPLSALDIDMRTKLQEELLVLHKRFAMTILMVSHDPAEIYRLAQRVIVLEEGKIIKDTHPRDIFMQKRHTQEASFEATLLDIIEVDESYIAVVSKDNTLFEVGISSQQVAKIKIGQRVEVATKAFLSIIG